MRTEYTYDELKGLCKQLFAKIQFIFWLTYMPIPVKKRQHILDWIHQSVGEAYNMTSEAEEKGLWK